MEKKKKKVLGKVDYLLQRMATPEEAHRSRGVEEWL